MAVLATNEPPTFKLACCPKTIPLGLRKNRLAVPDALINPSILEISPPVTRLKMFCISNPLLNEAVPPVGTENRWKLWNKLRPACVPPVILKTLPLIVTLELFGKVLSGVIWAVAQLAEKTQAPPRTIPNN